ncbi:hypothetical protein DYY88_11635 [Leptolyngbya iicbica LK]|uniref:Uncharacterized protein n=2 Tax=Cyanophyceae TaxID=3028117 RepID=A0A4V2E2V4_9CYAN|nr:hypothetical protein DYY88_11635 [Leptolyngbya sp. LK]
MAALNAFRDSDSGGVWPHLDKAEIISEMRSRLHSPFRVNQGQQPFCGPASILFELIRKFPLRYVELCQSLYETGGFQAQTRQIQASGALRQASQGELRMGPADWMVLATLRESENFLFPVEPNAPELVRNLAGMTKFWEMKGWVREILGYSRVEYFHTYVLRDLAALKKSQQILDQGGVALGLVTAENLLGQEKSRITVPNHWIALVGNVDIQKGTFWQHDSGHVSFDVFTWAKRVTIEADEGVFEDAFWGVVLGYET